MGEELSREERILRVMKQVLTSVARDTATQPGMRHPLREQTIEDMRLCLLLISEREKELAEAAGRNTSARPHFTDEPRPQGDVVIPITSIGRRKKDNH
ncbi:MAG: segregation and condensation protein A [Thiohalomonadaceae bacterium]